MTHTSPDAWCDRLQAKLMAGLEAAWAIIETSTDPAARKLAREKARVCGEMAAAARKIAAMTARKQPVSRPAGGFGAEAEAYEAERPARKLDQLRGGAGGGCSLKSSP